MPVEVLALGAAVAYASTQIISKFATRDGSVMAGLVVSLGAGTLALGAAAVVTVPSWRVPAPALAMFVLAGVAGAGVGRLLMMRSVRDAGASVASPLQSSAQPVAATAAAVLLLGERVSAGRLLALGLVVAGLWLCARGGSANRVHGGAGGAPDGARRLGVLWWPVAAGTALAVADVFRKTGLTWFAAPVLGAFLGVAAAFLGWLVVLAVRARTPRARGSRAARPAGESGAAGQSRAVRHRLAPPPSYWWYGLHGLLTAGAAALLLSALRAGDLSVVAPIIASQPVVVVTLSAVLLRDLESLRTGTVLGALVVFGGVATMSVTGT